MRSSSHYSIFLRAKPRRNSLSFQPSKMGKKKGSQPKPAPTCSRMYPSLHQDVADAVSEHITDLEFHKDDSDEGISKRYSTYVMGFFNCYTPTCSTQGWFSGRVTILIRRYRDGGYNAVVFKQRCEECNWLGKLAMDKSSYVGRVQYRLLKWAGVVLERPIYRSKKSPPHKAHLCEGCKSGICRAVSIQNRY